ncbi:MAG: hypothetical protein ACLSWY_14375 [Ruthenibacterium lactatiformans]
MPELQAPFEAQCRENWVDGTDGPYVIWGMGLMPCILERLAYEEQNKDLLDRTFAFFEKMACASEEVRELLLYAVLEKLGDDKAVLAKARLLMGAKRWNIPAGRGLFGAGIKL